MPVAEIHRSTETMSPSDTDCAAEARIGEFKRVIAPKLSSVQRHRNGAPHRKRKAGMAENEVTLLLAALAYELVHAIRCLIEESTGEGMSLDRVAERVLKVPRWWSAMPGPSTSASQPRSPHSGRRWPTPCLASSPTRRWPTELSGLARP